MPGLSETEYEEIDYWRLANTDIVIAKKESGEQAGQYVFSAVSVQQLPRWYRTMSVLPHIDENRTDYYQKFLLSPGPLLPKGFIQSLPSYANSVHGSLPLWQWGALACVLAACFGFMKLSFALGYRFNKLNESKGLKWKVGRLLSLIGGVLILLVARMVIDDGIWITGAVYQFLATTFLIAQFIFVSWLIMAFFNYIAEIYVFKKYNGAHVDSSLITVLARIIGAFIIVILGIYMVEFMGFSISPILAGLGVGGLAVALAIRPVLENVINGLTLYADGGVKIGELCRIDDKLGTIESIGLRSTRIRTLERSLVTIPNSEFANMEIDNLERRDMRRMDHVLKLRPEMTPEQLRVLLVNTRRVLLQHPKVEEEPIRVRLMGVGDYAINIGLVVYIRSNDHDEFLAIQEDLLFLVLQQVENVGVQLAFSNQYQFANHIPEVNEELQEVADATVAKWHEDNNFPFPDFSFEYRYDMKDTTIYPAKTSAVLQGPTV